MNASYMKKLKEEFRLSDVLPTFKNNSQTSRLGLLITTKISCCQRGRNLEIDFIGSIPNLVG